MLAGVAVPVLVGVGLLLWMQDRPVFGGLGGCGMVRSFDGQRTCYTREIEAALRSRGMETGLRVVERAAARDSLLATHCHPVLHRTGARAARGRDGVTRAVRELPSGHCTDGYLHGYLLGLGSRLAPGDVVDMCPLGSRGAGSRLRDCAHTFGHQQVRSVNLAAALTRCGEIHGTARSRRLVADGDLRATCEWGAFMEVVFQDPNIASFERTCASFDGPSRTRCFEFLPVGAGMSGADGERAAASCGSLRARDDAKACARGFGRAAPASSACAALRPYLRPHCRIGHDAARREAAGTPRSGKPVGGSAQTELRA